MSRGIISTPLNNETSFFLENGMKSMFKGRFSNNLTKNDPIELSDDQIKQTIYQVPIASTLTYYQDSVSNIDVTFAPSPEIIQNSIRPNSFDFVSNETMVPETGSLVEVFHPDKGTISFGVVIHEQVTKFKHDSLVKILDVDGSVIHVKPTNVRFHLHRFFQSAYIEEIEDNQEVKLNIQHAMRAFIDYSMTLRDRLADKFDITYANLAKENCINGANLEILLESTPHFFIEDTPLKNHGLLLAFHIQLSNDPINWMVSNIPNINKQFSNSLVNVSYIANTISNSESISKFIDQMSEEHSIENSKRFFSKLKQTQSDVSTRNDLDIQLGVMDTSNSHIIHTMAYFIIYPHPVLKTYLEKVFEGTIPHVSPDSVYKYLLDIKLYTPDTDIYLSARLFGDPASDKLQIESPNQLVSTQQTHNDFSDKFPHLREKQYFPDHQVYALPTAYLESIGLAEYSEIAVSVERLNSRKYFLNIHIPDIATKISPKSQLFHDLQDSGQTFKLANGFKNLFSKENLKELCFQSTRFSDDATTCLTFSIVYQPWERNAWKEPEIQITFDRIHNIRKLTVAEMHELLDSRSEILPINFFERLPEDSLTKQDKENIKFIHSIVKSSFWERATNSALISNVHGSKVTFDKNQNGETTLNVEEIHKLSNFEVFERELRYMVGDITARYGVDNDLPLLYNSQAVMYESDYSVANFNEGSKHEEEQSIVISPENYFLPEYKATTYDHFTVGKNQQGEVSPTAFVCGLNYLTNDTYTVDFATHYRLGLTHGHVDSYSVLSNFASLINQYQVLLHQVESYNNRLDGNMYCIYKAIESGYNIYTYTEEELTIFLLKDIVPCKIAKEEIGLAQKKYWVLRWLEMEMGSDPSISQTVSVEDPKYADVKLNTSHNLISFFKCVITETASSEKLGKAFCLELGIEVEVLMGSSDILVGDRIMCSKIIYLNPIQHRIVLMM